MSHKRNEALRHVQHSMHHVIAAGEGSDRAPDSCKLCPSLLVAVALTGIL